MDKQEIRDKLKNSIEVSTVRLWVKIELGMVALVCGLHFLASMGAYWDVDPWAFYGFVAAIVLVPMFGVHGFELWRIFRKAESYRLYETKLTQPHGTYWRAMYFTVLLQDEGGTLIRRTHAIFGTGRQQWGPLMEDYLNKTVTVAYNEETEEVVVIG